jgi:hypothetical protein
MLLCKRLVAGRGGVEVPAVLGHHGVQLGVDVAPLAHAAHVDEVLAQQVFLLAVAEFVGGGGGRVRRGTGLVVWSNARLGTLAGGGLGG